MSDLQAVFFDLDGTLLEINMAAFLPRYLQVLGGRFAHILPPDQFIARLLQATDMMVANDGSATNEEVFAAAFYPLAGHTQRDLAPLLDAFYAEDFPKLGVLAQPRSGARAVVEAAFDRGYAVIIATNPVFPATAIHQRIAWAGLADLPFHHVTTFENSRFCKPSLGYFNDLAARLSLPPAACLVVGDEAMDMAAGSGGFPTFLVFDPSARLNGDSPPPTYTGALADVAALLRAPPF
jgi:FMN phosphatase YigB (HAD superfamily)